MQPSLKAQLDYARFVHLGLIFTLGLFIFLFTKIPHKWWVWLTFMALGIGIEPGAMLSRSMHRFRGTLSALIFLIPLLYVMQLNFRLVPIVSIIMMVSLNVAGLNRNRYDIVVFFITLMSLLMTIQVEPKVTLTTSEGPFEVVMNRGVCTFIGILLVYIMDHFLYNAFYYSEKYFLLMQMELCTLIEEKKVFIETHHAYTRHGQIVLIQFRKQFNQHFTALMQSAENLMVMFQEKKNVKRAEGMDVRVEGFVKVSWALREILFAMAFNKFVLKSSEPMESLEVQYTTLLEEAKSLYLPILKNNVKISATFKA